jgi:hypothetical protein
MQKIVRNSVNGNRDFTDQQRADGGRLVTLISQGADDAALLKAGFVHDNHGQWFFNVGDHKVKLEASNSLGAAGTIVTVPNYVLIPSPIQPTQAGVGVVPFADAR